MTCVDLDIMIFWHDVHSPVLYELCRNWCRHHSSPSLLPILATEMNRLDSDTIHTFQFGWTPNQPVFLIIVLFELVRHWEKISDKSMSILSQNLSQGFCCGNWKSCGAFCRDSRWACSGLRMVPAPTSAVGAAWNHQPLLATGKSWPNKNSRRHFGPLLGLLAFKLFGDFNDFFLNTWETYNVYERVLKRLSGNTA